MAQRQRDVRLGHLSAEFDQVLRRLPRAEAGIEGGGRNILALSRAAEGVGLQQLGVAPEGGIPAESENNAVRLLAQTGYDAVALQRDLQAIPTTWAPSGGADPLRSSGVEGYLEHYHTMVIMKAVEESIKSAEEDFEFRQRSWETDEWSMSKQRFMERLGHKALSSSFEQKRIGLGAPGSAPLESITTTTASPALFQTLAITDQQGAATAIPHPQQAAYEKGLKHNLELLQAMVGQDTGRIQITSDSLAEGARRFLESKTLEYLTRKGNMVVAKGQALRSTSSRELESQLSANVGVFVREVVLKQLPDMRRFQSPEFWPKVYFCLRCGGVREAIELLAHSREDTWAGRFLEKWIELTRFSGQDPNASLTTQLMEAKMRCEEELKVMQQQTTSHPFRECVYNLTSLSDPHSPFPESLHSLFTIEDAVWTSLWFSNPKVRQASNRYEFSSFFRVLLDNGGAGHVDPKGRNPFKYTQVLLLLQRFSEAVAHLVRAGLNDYAVRICVPMLCYGLVSPTALLPNEEGHSYAYAHERTQGESIPLWRIIEMKCERLGAVSAVDLLVQCFKTHEEGAEVLQTCLTNLITRAALKSPAARSLSFRQPSPNLASKKEDELHSLVGTGAGGGHLRSFYSQEEISEVLKRSAVELQSQLNESECATYLLYLAGEYAHVLAVVNQNLSSELTRRKQGRGTVASGHWAKIAKSLYELFTKDIPVQVEERMGVGMELRRRLRTLGVLLGLGEVLTLHQQNMHSAALEEMYGMELLPASREEIPKRLPLFLELLGPGSGRAGAVCGPVCEVVMECLVQRYHTLSAQLGEQQATRRIREKARALAAFVSESDVSALITADSRSNIQRMESKME